jgi:hypothetical protein
LRSIKHVQKNKIGSLDVIVTGEFFQFSPVRNKWVFQKIDESLNAIVPNFWCDHNKCYELITIMRQNDLMFVNIIDSFKRANHTIKDIDTINNLCLKGPPKDSTIPYLIYTNKKIMVHNDKNKFNAIGPYIVLKQLVFNIIHYQHHT